MVTHIDPVLRSGNMTRETSELILQVELQLLTHELPELKRYRDYLNGEQTLVYGHDKFKAEFGPAFRGFRDNWSSVVVEAPLDKLFFEGIILGADKEEREANLDLARRIWNIFRENDWDEQQGDLFEGSLTEGRGYVICWPGDQAVGDPLVRIDWNRADLMRVRYADDDPRTIIWAMKRWLTPSGEVNITVYTRNFIYKYKEVPVEYNLETRTGMDALAPDNSPSLTFEQRFVPGEQWPLPNPFGFVPVVEFVNRRGSELTDVIPLQDGVNFLMYNALNAAGFQGFPQRGFFTANKEPPEGWSNHPGRVWQIKPDIDAEGGLQYGSTFEFDSADLSGFRQLVEMVLQHIALQTKTPVRMFMESDRGGRGDSPSGDSLLVQDQPLLDKVGDRQRRFGNSAFRLARMVAVMADYVKRMQDLPLGEVDWHDPRSRYRTALIEEAALMVDKMGLPLTFVIRQLGLSQDEVDFLEEEIEKQKAEQQAQLDKELAASQQSFNRSQDSGTNPDN